MEDIRRYSASPTQQGDRLALYCGSKPTLPLGTVLAKSSHASTQGISGLFHLPTGALTAIPESIWCFYRLTTMTNAIPLPFARPAVA